MSELVRFSVSLEADLLEEFDRFCLERNMATRSEAIRQLLRRALTEEGWAKNANQATATLTLVYDHHRTGLLDALNDVQHDHPEMVVSTMHVHLDHHNCLEVIILRGEPDKLRDMASRLQGMKGIRCGDLVVAHVVDPPHHA